MKEVVTLLHTNNQMRWRETSGRCTGMVGLHTRLYPRKVDMRVRMHERICESRVAWVITSSRLLLLIVLVVSHYHM